MRQVGLGSLLLLAALPACGGGGAAPSASTPASTTATAKDAPEVDVDASPAPPAAGIDCGDFTTCAVAEDGLVRCWGRNKDGELGAGHGAPDRAKRGIVPGVAKAKKVVLASQFACALLEDESVTCWGTGRVANDGSTVEASKPVPVQGVAEVKDLSASGTIVCARTAKGVSCWGGESKSIGTPPPTAFKQVATGFNHACGLDEKGAVQCWGGGPDWGGKGPFAKPAITGAVQVVTGDRHGCVITKDKTVQCWGLNDAGQLGTKPDMVAHPKPSAVAGVKGAVGLVAGEASTCALLEDGGLKCWGANAEGELGLGTRTSDERPQPVSGASAVDHLCVGSAHACALTKEKKVLCWGANAFGQLGDGSKERRLSPTPVVW